MPACRAGDESARGGTSAPLFVPRYRAAEKPRESAASTPQQKPSMPRASPSAGRSIPPSRIKPLYIKGIRAGTANCRRIYSSAERQAPGRKNIWAGRTIRRKCASRACCSTVKPGATSRASGAANSQPSTGKAKDGQCRPGEHRTEKTPAVLFVLLEQRAQKRNQRDGNITARQQIIDEIRARQMP